MANYAQYSIEHPDGTTVTKARLTLEGWSPPEYWEQTDQVPEGWPTTAVAALIHLFTSMHPANAGEKGVEIPNSLGWHIATLFADWGDYAHSINYPTKSELPHILSIMANEFPEEHYTPTTATNIALIRLRAQRTQTSRYLATHARE